MDYVPRVALLPRPDAHHSRFFLPQVTVRRNGPVLEPPLTPLDLPHEAVQVLPLLREVSEVHDLRDLLVHPALSLLDMLS